MSSLAMPKGDWSTVRDVARRRQLLGARLSLMELMDADHMVTWSSLSLGEPLEALRSAEASARRLRAGQLPEWLLSTTIWRTRALITLGRWNDALEVTRQALNQTRSLGHTPAWVSQALPLALVVARAMGQSELATELVDVLVNANPTATDRQRAILALIRDNPADACSHLQSVAGDSEIAWLVDGDLVWYLADCGQLGPDGSWLRRVALTSGPVAVQVARARGLFEGKTELLDEALRLARRMNDAPATARLCVELGRATEDPALVDEGRALLSGMCDQRQMERYGLEAVPDHIVGGTQPEP
ncbi:MAG: hypothetical protein ACYDAY_03935 [Candidatus Dormibacteria bacterium]